MKNKLVLLVAVVAFSLSIWSYIGAEGTEIIACAQKNNGHLFLINLIDSQFKFKLKDCQKNGKVISWNSIGPAGPQGQKGDKGEQGIPGVSAPMLPSMLAPSVTDLRLCKSYNQIRLEWKLSNSYGSLERGGFISSGTLTNGVWSKSVNGIQNDILFLLTQEELSTMATGTPVSFSGNVWGHGFVVSIAGSGISQEVPMCQSL